MKKIAIMTSFLALTACGGGSGGGSDISYNNALGNVEIPTSRVSNAASVSNSAVTAMESSITNISEMTAAVEAVIGSEALNNMNFEEISAALNRSATTRHSSLMNSNVNQHNKEKAAYVFLEGGKIFNNWGYDKKRDFFTAYRDIVVNWGKVFCHCNDITNLSDEDLLSIFDNNTNKENFDNFYEQNHYREYTLENVEFTMAAASAGHGDEGGSKDVFKFRLDDKGKIDAVIWDAYISNNGTLERDDSATAVFTRNNDENNSFHVEQTNGEGHHYEGNGVFTTYGRDLGLKYSDFGQGIFILDVDGEEDTENSYEPFAGGYKFLRKDSPETAMNFTGKAVGSVSNHDFAKNVYGPATLEFDNGAETLNMNFTQTTNTADDTPWYNVTITRNTNNNSIVFETNGTVNANIPEDLRFNDFNDNTRTPNEYHLVDGYNGAGYHPDENSGKIIGDGYGKLEIGYYGGIDGNVTEATGVTQYVESTDQNNEIRMNIGFGMVKVAE